MNLIMLPIPTILPNEGMSSRILWEKWYAFWNLPRDRKEEIIHEYPELVIEKEPSPEAKSMGIMTRKYFDPDTFDRIVPYGTVFRHYDTITDTDSYPRQRLNDVERYVLLDGPDEQKSLLFVSLEPLNYAVLAYKYRYSVRPENYYFGMDYENALLNVTTLKELLSFYDFTRKD